VPSPSRITLVGHPDCRRGSTRSAMIRVPSGSKALIRQMIGSHAKTVSADTAMAEIASNSPGPRPCRPIAAACRPVASNRWIERPWKSATYTLPSGPVAASPM
jgi:hypothetical protein